MEKKTIAVCAIIGVMEHERLSAGKNGLKNLPEFSFDEKTKSIEEFKQMEPVEQLSYLSSAIEALGASPSYGLDDIDRLFEDVAKDKECSPLIRIVAESGIWSDDNFYETTFHDDLPSYQALESFGYSTVAYPEMISERSDDPKIEQLDKNDLITTYETNSDYNERFEAFHQLRRLLFHNNQEKLHQEFPSLPKGQCVKIAKDAAAKIKWEEKFSFNEDLFGDSAKLGQIHDKTGAVDGLDNNTLLLLSSVHTLGRVKPRVESALGLKLIDLSLGAQIQLLKYMTEAGDDRYYRLCSDLEGENQSLKVKLAENFLAADFGEDFGDALLTVAESTRFDDKEKEAILDDISSCRKSIKSITGLYEHIDGEFAKEYARAANERLTDALMVFSEIAKKGYAEADLDWAGKNRFSYNSAIEALDYEKKSLEIISGTFNDVISGKTEAYAKVVLHPDEEFQRLRRTVYDLYSPDHGHVLIYTRADGSHSFDPDVEYGKVGSRYNEDSRNTGVEASISMIADPVNPFATISPYKPNRFALKNLNYYDDDTMNKVSAIRLDREGRAPGWAADDSRRDPVNQVGTISVDLAAIGDRADTPSGKIARLLAVGNSLRASRMGSETSLNHNTNWFNQAKYGTSDGFKKIVEEFDMSLRRLVEIRQPRARLKKMGSIANMARTDDDPAA